MTTESDNRLTPPEGRAVLEGEPILKFFSYSHLPPALQEVSRTFADMAGVIMQLPRCAERSVALRKLLESKDAAVRAKLEGLAAKEPKAP